MVIFQQINYRLPIKSLFSLLLIIVVLPQSQALGQTGQDPISVDDISPKQITINALKANEILLKETGTANNLQELLINPTYQKISRDVTWQKRVQLDRLESPLKVTYELKAKNGQSNRFSNNQNSTSVLDVVFKNSQSDIIFRNESRNLAVVEGTVRLEFDSSKAKAGEHAANLIVCVKSRDGGCL
jgi:hypothetical protein